MAEMQLAPRKSRLMRLIYWLAALEAVLAAVFTLLSAGADLFARTIDTRMPVQSFWPLLKQSVQLDPAPSARVTGGGFSLADVSVSGLDVGTRIWLAFGDLFHGCLVVAIGIAVAVLADRLMRGDPFGKFLSNTAFATAAAIGFAGILWQVCSGIGGSLVSARVLTVTGWTIGESDVSGGDLSALGWPLPSTGFTVDFWPIGAALALAAVAIAFRYGEKLQTEAVILKRQKRALQRDTDGLV